MFVLISLLSQLVTDAFFHSIDDKIEDSLCFNMLTFLHVKIPNLASKIVQLSILLINKKSHHFVIISSLPKCPHDFSYDSNSQFIYQFAWLLSIFSTALCLLQMKFNFI